MVVRKSEYQNQFKACIIKKHQDVYLENLNLRHQRRDREFVHTPICWEELSEEDEKVSSDCSDEGQPKSAEHQTQKEPETQYQSLAEILTDAREKAEAVRKQKHTECFVRPSSSNESTQKKLFHYTDALTKVPEEKVEKVTQEINYLNQKSEKKNLANKSESLIDYFDDGSNKLSKKLALTYAIRPEGDMQDISRIADHDSKVTNELLKESTKPSASSKRTKAYRKKRNEEPEVLSKMKQSSEASMSSARIQNAVASSKGHYHVHQPTESPNPESYVPPLVHIPRVRRPDRQACIPRTSCTPVSPELPMKERPPFIAYGIGDRENNLAIHRTHNVRASVDVYPPALRAKTRREEHHKRQKEKIHRARSAENLRDKLSSAFTPDPHDWESEYRKQFHGYQPKDYEKAVTSHSVIPRSSKVRAVNRGGCVLVHVD